MSVVGRLRRLEAAFPMAESLERLEAELLALEPLAVADFERAVSLADGIEIRTHDGKNSYRLPFSEPFDRSINAVDIALWEYFHGEPSEALRFVPQLHAQPGEEEPSTVEGYKSFLETHAEAIVGLLLVERFRVESNKRRFAHA